MIAPPPALNYRASCHVFSQRVRALRVWQARFPSQDLVLAAFTVTSGFPRHYFPATTCRSWQKFLSYNRPRSAFQTQGKAIGWTTR
jgi:hypothetical protein